MYELPSFEGVVRVVVDEAVIMGEKSPYLIYEDPAVEERLA